MQPSTEPFASGPAGVVSADGRVVHLTIPAKAEYITLCRLALVGIASVRAFDDEVLADLKLALTEACSNSVRHAYANGEGGHVHVTYELARDRITVEVIDDGAGFDPALEASGIGELSEGGLGIAIIKAIADEFELVSQAGRRGSRLRFVKLLTG